MRSTLAAISAHRGLKLQIIATGMHLDHSRGYTLDEIGHVDAVIPWPANERREISTGRAMAAISTALQSMKSDIVLVVGDRVEAFAAAAAGAIGGRVVAHVHGGDRALGQVDDSLRHAISKLAHIHFPATAESARRLLRMGEDRRRIHRVGSPGIDGILKDAAAWSKVSRRFPGLVRRRYALTILHPVDSDERLEQRRAVGILRGLRSAGIRQIVVIDPNNDPGAAGIMRAWREAGCIRATHLDRSRFLGLLRDAALLAGNSSAGIIEAAGFRTPVIDIGPRQLGRECAKDVRHVDYSGVRGAAARIWNHGWPRRSRGRNPYHTNGRAGAAIAEILGRNMPKNKLLQKLIAY